LQRNVLRALTANRRPRGRRIAFKDLLFDGESARDCVVVELLQACMTAFGFFGQHDRDDLESLLDAIESDHRAVKHPESIGWTIQRLCLVVAECGLEPLRGVVTNVTD